MAQNPPRIQDVARAAGVSTATVSRTISNPDLVTETTRAAVLEAIRSTGYRVNRAARNLRRQRAGAVLVLVPGLGNPFFSQILAGIGAGFAGSDYSVLIADSDDLANRRGAVLDYFLDSRIDGMISLDGRFSLDDLAAFERGGAAEHIVFACEWVQGARLPSVRSDNPQGARLAIRHLHALGHRGIAHVTGPEDNVLTHARREAMLAERRRLDLPAPPDWIMRGDFSLGSGEAAAARIAEMRERPTAVFCVSDMAAFGLISGLAMRGISVPGDISVVGFDDIEMAAHYVPSLTTVRQDRRALGALAATRLLRRLDGTERQGRSIAIADDLLDVELVVRASTAPPPR